MPRVTVTVRGKTPQPYRFDLDRISVTLGRGSENDIPIDCPSISVKHALMRRITGGYELRDLGSTNGIKGIDGRHMVIPLVSGVPVKMGDVLFEFDLTEDEEKALATEKSDVSPTSKTAPMSDSPKERSDKETEKEKEQDKDREKEREREREKDRERDREKEREREEKDRERDREKDRERDREKEREREEKDREREREREREKEEKKKEKEREKEEREKEKERERERKKKAKAEAPEKSGMSGCAWLILFLIFVTASFVIGMEIRSIKDTGKSLRDPIREKYEAIKQKFSTLSTPIKKGTPSP